jgi:hypothetical protein
MAQDATKRPSNAHFYGPLKLSLHFRPFQTFLKCTQNFRSFHPPCPFSTANNVYMSVCLSYFEASLSLYFRHFCSFFKSVLFISGRGGLWVCGRVRYQSCLEKQMFFFLTFFFFFPVFYCMAYHGAAGLVASLQQGSSISLYFLTRPYDLMLH